MHMSTLWRQFHTLLWAEQRCSACSSVFPAVHGKDAVTSLDPEIAVAAVFQEAGWHFCPECRARLRFRERGYCPVCGELAAWEEQPCMPCGRCLKARTPWVEAVFWGVHEDLLRDLLLRLKFQKELPLAHALGCLLAKHPRLQGLEADVVIPIPLHTTRLKQRGFNQSLELARPVAGHLHLPLDTISLLKTRVTEPQHNLPRKDRQVNIRQAFTARRSVNKKRILLVDDTMTTGATMQAAASALLAAGAASIHLAVASRTAAVF